MRTTNALAPAACILLLILPPTAATAPAHAATPAQPQARSSTDSDAPTVVIASGQSPTLRSRGFARAYPVATVPTGTPLLVIEDPDARGDSPWLAVAWPKDRPLLVPADHAAPADEPDTIALVRPSALRLPHLELGPDASWASATDSPLPEGTQLALRRTLTGPQGRPTAYLVDPPIEQAAAAPRAYIRRNHTRPATPEELRVARRTLGIPTLATPAGDAGPSAQDALASPQTPETRPDRSNDTASLADPMRVPDGALDNPDRPAVVIDQGEPAPPPGPRDQPANVDPASPLSLADLNRKYETLKAQPLADAEWQPLLAEHQRALDALADDPFAERTRQQIRARIEMINARIKLQERILEPLRNADRLEPIETIDPVLIRQRLEQIQSVSTYSFIGRLVTSPLYDGNRLPELLRLRSIRGSRDTIGYIRVGDDDPIRSLLGQPVGIVGSIAEDPALPLRIIRIHSIEPIDLTTPPATTDDDSQRP